MAALLPSQEELVAFHATHFSKTSTNHFAAQFLGPVEDAYAESGNGEAVYYEEEYVEDEDDGLGYYPDGVKRNLTNEQIAIFRHSEIQALLRERRHAKEAQENEVIEAVEEQPVPLSIQEPAVEPFHEPIRPIIGPVMEEPDLEDGELQDNTTETSAPTPASDTPSGLKKSKKKKKKNKPSNISASQRDTEPKAKGFFKQNVKPDLRKRTWDVVDRGLDGLDYDEMDGGAAVRPCMVKRRQISYDD